MQIFPRRAYLPDLEAVVALQRAAYAQNREILGVEPLPLQADYRSILDGFECWIAECDDAAAGFLALEWRADNLLIWSIATAPAFRGRRIGSALLDLADRRGREQNLHVIRLYTGEKLVSNIAWYERHGYVIERIEQMADRRAVHMVKHIK